MNNSTDERAERFAKKLGRPWLEMGAQEREDCRDAVRRYAEIETEAVELRTRLERVETEKAMMEIGGLFP